MKASEIFERLIKTYQSNFDIINNYRIDDYIYAAFASFNARCARYVLVKQAELWQARSYEYVLFDITDRLDSDHIEEVLHHVKEHIEPKCVRKNEKYPEKNHMYSYITVMFLCDGGITEEAAKVVQKSKMYINYMMSLRGYCQLRVVAIDADNDRIITNKAASLFRKELRKLF